MANRTTKTPEVPANPLPTLTPEALQQLLAEVAASREELVRQKMELDALKSAKPAVVNGQSVSAKNDLACLRVFKKAGFKDIQPRKNVLTFNRWIELGRRPAEGSKSLKVSGMRLFHITQTRPLSAEEIKAMKAAKDQPAAPRTGKAATVTELHPQ